MEPMTSHCGRQYLSSWGSRRRPGGSCGRSGGGSGGGGSSSGGSGSGCWLALCMVGVLTPLGAPPPRGC